MNKKILYINNSFSNDSGAGIIAKDTFELFKKHGYNVEIFTRLGAEGGIHSKYQKLFSKAFSSPIEYIMNLHKYYYNATAAKKMALVLDDFKPDIIHAHSLWCGALTYSVLKPCINRNIPIVMTLHDAFFTCPTMTLLKGMKENCNIKCGIGHKQYNCIINRCDENIERAIRWALVSFIYELTGYNQKIAKFITPSNALKQLLLNSINYMDNSNVVVVNNFLNASQLKLLPKYLNKGYFLYIGRLSKEKSVITLLQAMKDLPKEIKLHIVGMGPEEVNLKRYVKLNNLYNIKFLGFKNREEIKEEYQNCIATILPCNWFENFPTTNMESFINGKPVIASNIGGIPEQVEHNKTGLLFRPANVEQLKECILKYWNNPELVIEHGKNGYQKAITQYTEERYYNELLNVYKEVLNEPNKSTH